MGRKRKFKLGEIVQNDDGHHYVIVDHQLRSTKSEYRIIPLNNRYERYGRATWEPSNTLHSTGLKSTKGSLVTYRANRMLEAEIGRACACECCVHTALDRKDFSTRSGRHLVEVDDEQ